MNETDPDVCDRLFARISPSSSTRHDSRAKNIIVNRVVRYYEHLPTLDNFLGHRNPQHKLLHILQQGNMSTSSVVVIYIRAIPWQP